VGWLGELILFIDKNTEGEPQRVLLQVETYSFAANPEVGDFEFSGYSTWDEFYTYHQEHFPEAFTPATPTSFTLNGKDCPLIICYDARGKFGYSFSVAMVQDFSE